VRCRLIERGKERGADVLETGHTEVVQARAEDAAVSRPAERPAGDAAAVLVDVANDVGLVERGVPTLDRVVALSTGEAAIESIRFRATNALIEKGHAHADVLAETIFGLRDVEVGLKVDKVDGVHGRLNAAV